MQITADPSDINVLAEYDSDPRVVGNLLDGVNQTRDDVHMWLAPFTPGSNHLVCLEFTIPYALALVRIWVREIRQIASIPILYFPCPITHANILGGDFEFKYL